MGVNRSFALRASYLVVAFSLLSACGHNDAKSGPSAVTEEPGSWRIENTQLASIVVSGYQPPQFASLTFNVQRRYPTNIVSENSASWSGSDDWLFKLPASLTPSYGRPGNASAYLDFKPKNGSGELRCIYRGNGSSVASGTCGASAGTSYNFLMCMKKSDWSASLESSCATNYAGTSACAAKNLGILDGDTVAAADVAFNLAGGSACVVTPATESKVTLAVPLANFNRACGGAALPQGSWRKLPWEPSGSFTTRDASVHLFGDMKCDDVNDHTQPQPANGYAIGAGLTVIGDQATVHGHGQRIRAKKSRIGLLVNGRNLTVRDIEASDLDEAYSGDTATTGGRGGAGLMAYDTQNLTVRDSTFDNNRIGIELFGENIDIVGVTVRDNSIQDSQLFGIRMRGEKNFIVSAPVIENNDLSDSGEAAIQLLRCSDFVVTGTYASPTSSPKNHTNVFTGSATALYFQGTSLIVQNLDLSGSGVNGNQIFVANTQSLNLLKSNLSTNAPASPSGIRVGAHAYNVSTVYVDGLKANGGDIGVKVAIDAGVTGGKNVTVMNSDLKGNVNAGVQVQAYDSTGYGNIAIGQNDLSGYYSGYNSWYGQNVWYGAWIVPGTTGNLNFWNNLQ